jgi:hypothetical protein
LSPFRKVFFATNLPAGRQGHQATKLHKGYVIKDKFFVITFGEGFAVLSVFVPIVIGIVALLIFLTFRSGHKDKSKKLRPRFAG